jgi:hypothetical protein
VYPVCSYVCMYCVWICTHICIYNLLGLVRLYCCSSLPFPCSLLHGGSRHVLRVG